MQSFLAHLHKGHPLAISKSKKLTIETPREPRKLIFGNVISKYGTDGIHGYDASRHVNLSVACPYCFEIRLNLCIFSNSMLMEKHVGA